MKFQIATLVSLMAAAQAAHSAIVVATSMTTTATLNNNTTLADLQDGWLAATTGAWGTVATALDESNKFTLVSNSTEAWRGGGAANWQGQCESDNVNGRSFTFNFSSATIGQILVWNFSQNAIRGLDSISNVEIDTGSGFTSVLTNFNLQTAAAAGFKAQAIDLSSTYNNVSAIRLTVAQGITGGTETAGGFDEVAFSSVPEPSAALLGGLGILGLLRRRRG